MNIWARALDDAALRFDSASQHERSFADGMLYAINIIKEDWKLAIKEAEECPKVLF